MPNNLSILPAADELADIQTEVSAVENFANALVVDSTLSMNKATEALHNVAVAEKFVTSKKEIITRPLMESLSQVRDLFRPLESNLAEAKKTIKAKMLAWQVAEDERIEKEKERIAARVEKGTMRADTAANKLEQVGETNKSGIRTLKKVRIIDEAAIPRMYMMPNMTKITEDILRHGITILGVEIYNEKQIVAR